MKITSPKLLVLGSAAAEGIPAYCCNCRVCREAAAKGGKEIRGRTSYNFGDVLQIDYGPDMLHAFQRFYPRLNNIRHLLITHAHEDHLDPAELWFRISGCSHIPEDAEPMVIHASEPAFELIRRGMAPTMCGLSRRAKMLDAAHIAFHRVEPFETFELPDIGATVRTLAAQHALDLIPMLFLITMGGRTVLIGNDTGVFPDETKEALKALAGKVHIDVAVLDDTDALHPGWPDTHMGAAADLEAFAALDSWGLTDEETIRVVNHFSHNGGSTHEELCAFFEPKGIVVGYDGLEL